MVTTSILGCIRISVCVCMCVLKIITFPRPRSRREAGARRRGFRLERDREAGNVGNTDFPAKLVAAVVTGRRHTGATRSTTLPTPPPQSIVESLCDRLCAVRGSASPRVNFLRSFIFFIRLLCPLFLSFRCLSTSERARFLDRTRSVAVYVRSLCVYSGHRVRAKPTGRMCRLFFALVRR